MDPGITGCFIPASNSPARDLCMIPQDGQLTKPPFLILIPVSGLTVHSIFTVDAVPKQNIRRLNVGRENIQGQNVRGTNIQGDKCPWNKISMDKTTDPWGQNIRRDKTSI